VKAGIGEMVIFPQPLDKSPARGPDDFDAREKKKNNDDARNPDPDRYLTLHKKPPLSM
jgi:hypothetical protein